MEETLQNILSAGTAFFETYVLEAFRHISVIDVIDILLLTVVFYYIYRFVRDRRAGKLAVGLLLIMGIMACSEVFEMRAIQYVFQNFIRSDLSPSSSSFSLSCAPRWKRWAVPRP